MSEIYIPSKNKILIYSCLAISLAVLSYLFVDRPVATWTAYNSRVSDWHLLWQYPTHLEPFYYFISPWLVLYFIYELAKHGDQALVRKESRIVFLMIFAMWLSLLISEELRIIFGRHWPTTWFHGNLSYINNNVYGFKWFQSGHEFKSFPSGHTTLICAFMMALYWQVKNIKLKVFALVNCFLVAMGLILMCYHFVSDVIIGGLLGSLCAYVVLFGYQCLKK